jgi:formate hydrogenlyase transcriptional activator
MNVSAPTRTAAERYQTLLDVAESIASHQQVSSLLVDLGRALRRIVDFTGMTLTLYEPESRSIQLIAFNTPFEAPVQIGTRLPVELTPVSIVLATMEPLYVRDLDLEAVQFPQVYDLIRGRGIRSFVVVPLSTARSQFLGTVNFGSFEPDAWSAEEIEFMQQACRPVAFALENARNYEQLRAAQADLASERDRLELLLQINNAVVTNLDMPALFAAVSDCLRNHFDLDRADVIVPVADTNARDWTIRDDGRQCTIPLVFRDRTLGALEMESRSDVTFTEANLQLLTEIAAQIAIAVDNALSWQRVAELNARLADEKLYLEDEIRTHFRFEEIVGRSPALTAVLRQVETVAPSDSAVVICGETGTGKELIARAIHDLSRRHKNSFIKLNCAAIPHGLIESELFGHEKGAFTGALARRIGRFELADGGTLFLDEIGELPVELQPKLLRVLQEKEFERVGSAQTRRVNVRVIAATNRDLHQMVRDRQFRDDLYYRLNVFPITVPPLRNRREDIPLLVRHFAQQNARRMQRHIETIPAETMEALTASHWPGNVRELQNLIERAVILTRGTVLEVPLEGIRKTTGVNTAAVTLAAAERDCILEALRAADWVLAGPDGAAARLGMKRSTLQFRMKKLGIERP